MDPITIILLVIILIMSVVIHEVSHGYAALALGDRTAQYQGRLTLNPIKHLDPIGSVVVPLLMSFSGMIFGWAKPVPYNPYNLKNRRWGELLVALAGPLSNIFIALIFGILIRSEIFNDSNIFLVFALIVQVNLVLAVFNLVPIPPLDGSKILFAILPQKYFQFRAVLEQYGFFIVLIFIFFLWPLITPIFNFLFKIFTGLNF